MPTNLLLLPLLAGYLFIHRQHFLRFRANRLDGYRLLLESAIAGLLLTSAAWLLVGFLQRVPCLVQFWRVTAPDIPFLGTAALSLVLGLVLPTLLNVFLHVTGFHTIEEAQLSAVNRYGNNLQRLLHNAAFTEETVSVTLDSRKIYIGYITQAPNLEPHDTFVAILPIFSGYRDKDSLELILTTDYTMVCEKTDRPVNDFVQVVPISSIRSAGLFDPTVLPLFISNDEGLIEEVPSTPSDQREQPEIASLSDDNRPDNQNGV